MKIVVLDGHTLNPGDLSWDELKSLGECVIYERTPTEQVVARAAGAEIVLTNKTIVNREAILALRHLRWIGVLATGYNIVDVEAARERGIPVANVPNYGTRSVAQMTLALLLELTQHVGHHAQTVREGRWNRSPHFCYWDHPLVELDGLTLGIVGAGRIGRAVADLGRAFGMKVMGYSRSRPGVVDGIEYVDLEKLFRASDVVSLHCPLTPETKHIVNAQRLSWMKTTAFLLNTSRGPLIDEAALAFALNEGRIAGAGLDVLAVEPPVADNPLIGAKNCLITPHIAWATKSARSRLLNTAVDNLKVFLAGKARNVVNGA
ncbi:MAG: D-2-hydroxyacid dehydrogenase [Verrucomicrobiota bacterium]